MQDLTPVGLSKDGRRLVLISATGEEYAVTVDTRFRAALRGDTGRLGQLEMKMESALRPRDIQARIRAGESPEDVAVAAQTTVESIMGFATPVLAERAHVALTAQKASVRRVSGSPSAARTLGEAADVYFAGHSLHDQDVEWDSWRQPDGRWALVAAYAVGGRPVRAEFTLDLPGKYVVADNDEARLLTGELRRPEPRSGAGASGSADPAARARRLAAVRSQDELPLGDDAIELVRDPRPGDAVDGPDAVDAAVPEGSAAPEEVLERAPEDAPEATGAGTVDTELTEELPGASELASAQQPVADDADPTPDEPADESSEERPDFATRADDPDPAPDNGPNAGTGSRTGFDAGFDTGFETADADWMGASTAAPADRPTKDQPAEPQEQEPAGPSADEVGEVGEAAEADESPEQASAEKPKKRGRSSVPSWDEIMFGGGKGD